jgi:hypothetical protein
MSRAKSRAISSSESLKSSRRLLNAVADAAFSLFPFEVQQYFFRQRIGQAKRHEVGRTLAFHMRQVTARVNARAKWILNFVLCTSGTQLMTRSLQAGVRLVQGKALRGRRLPDCAKKASAPSLGSAGFQPAVSPTSNRLMSQFLSASNYRRQAGLKNRDTADLFAAANPSCGGEVCATRRSYRF